MESQVTICPASAKTSVAEFLLARALEHDSPTLLFRLACEYLISVRVIRPGPVTVLERVAHARAEAQRETYDRLAHEFTEQRRVGLDGLLVVDPEVGMTRLRWLRADRPPPKAVHQHFSRPARP